MISQYWIILATDIWHHLSLFLFLFLQLSRLAGSKAWGWKIDRRGRGLRNGSQRLIRRLRLGPNWDVSAIALIFLGPCAMGFDGVWGGIVGAVDGMFSDCLAFSLRPKTFRILRFGFGDMFASSPTNDALQTFSHPLHHWRLQRI